LTWTCLHIGQETIPLIAYHCPRSAVEENQEPEEGLDIAEALSISALEKETGVSRSTIHFYLREGLLPQPQKTAASRALYTQDHVRLLLRIRELKRAGHSLGDIRRSLADDIARAGDNHEDLAAQESDRIRRAILRLATEEFATKGYKETHIATITRTLGITSQVFYSHFPGKLQLFVESFRTFLSWNLAFVEPKLMGSQDPGERLLWRLLADYRATEFGSQVMAQIDSESSLSEADKHRLSEQAWDDVVARIKMDFEGARHPGSPPPAISLDLLCFSLIGAHHTASMRASWDERFAKADTLRVHLWLWLAVLAAMGGEIDVDSRVARYEELIQEVAGRKPETPPALDE
jgi:DNA-binding transcriptional MerR regulator